MTFKTAYPPAQDHAVDKASVLASLAASGCMVLLDPALRPTDEDPSWPAGESLRPVPIPLEHPRVDRRVLPQLLALRASDEAHARMLVHMLEESEYECTCDSLIHGRGRRIGGWLVTSASASDVGEHLGRTMLQRHSATSAHVWLRLHDPAVLWLLWPELSPPQQAALLGPIEKLYLLDPLGRMTELLRPGTSASSHPLELTPAQWSTVDAAGAANLALREWLSMCLGSSIRAHAEVALDASKRAARLGFDDSGDQAQFALSALKVHPEFERHPLVHARLEARAPEDYFGGLVADLDAAHWQRIATDLHAHPSASEPEHGVVNHWHIPNATH